MSIIASSKGSATAREPIPAGAYAARCYSVIDLGTQANPFEPGKSRRLVRITWEIPDERRVFNEEKGAQPCVISKEFTLSLGDNSNLRTFLTSWRGKGFTEEEAKGFDVAKLIGAPCLLNIIHVAGKKDPSKMYDEIGGITPLPKGMVCPAQENPSFEFSIQEWDLAAYESMPNFLKEKVAASTEYQTLLATGALKPTTVAPIAAAPPAQKAAPTAHPLTLEPDDLPF